MCYKNSMRISYHCWTESSVDLQEGQLMLQYYYVSNSNKHLNNKDEERMIIWRYYSGFCKFTIDCCRANVYL